MSRLLLVIFVLLAVPSIVEAQDADTDCILYLVDGTVLPGRIVGETGDLVVLQHASLGRIEVPRASIERVEMVGSEGARPDWYTDPSRNSILFTPTPATLPKGTGYFRSIELLFLNLGYAPTDFLNLAVGTTFPISADLLGIMVGTKLRVIDRQSFPIGLALTGSYTWFDELQDDALWTANAVAGIGDDRRSLNVAVGGIFSGSNSEGMVMAGADWQFGRRTKFVAEVGNSTSALFDDDDFNGLLNVGFRWFGDTMSFTLTGFRPLEDTGSVLFFPLAVFSFNF